jgi:hypothetical protein
VTEAHGDAIEMRSAFEAAGVFDCAESDVSNRLLYEDKVAILSAVEKHGRHALANITKGDSTFYSRETKSVSGPDADFLREVFLGQDPIDAGKLLRYTGPDKILLFPSEKAFQERGVMVIDSYSPFKDRAAYQPPYKDDVVTGHQFCATAQQRIPARILRMHGRIECCAASKLPRLIKNQWEGIWIPRTKFSDMFSRGSTMASDIGQIPVDGGDYLRYLLLLGAINGSKAPIKERSRLLLYVESIFGIDGHSFGAFSQRP